MEEDPGRADTQVVSTGGSRPARPRASGSIGGALPVIDLDSSRYRLGDVVGQGGMGEVVLAFDEYVGREVVLKRILAAQPADDEVARFVREARVQGRLEHPAVVPVHDLAIDTSGRPFFVMKRLTGTDLRELLDRLRGGKEPDPSAARRRLWRAFVEVCLAVEFAHARGVVHGDLKPANIMLGEYGEVYVIDWGVARLPGDSHAGMLLGTPGYMAPEHLAGEPAEVPADIYALGRILDEIAAGESPPEIAAASARATAVDPRARFASARALGDAVQAFLDGDRDIAARRDLARAHVEEARAALARGHGEEERRIAMRAAGRALALDPTTREAADVIGHLMLTPPTRVPDAVVKELEDIDIATARSQGRIGALAMCGYLGFLPLLFWTGIRTPSLIVAFAALAVINAGWVYAMTRRTRIPLAGIYLSAAIHAMLIGVVCRLTGPFVIAPTLVLTTLMAYAVHPRFGRIDVMALILTTGVALPWALEAAGVLTGTYRFVDGGMFLSSPVIEYSAAPVQLAFLGLLVLMAAVVAALLRTMARRTHAVTAQLELQAWQLRQIV